jgi:hypothetical protein
MANLFRPIFCTSELNIEGPSLTLQPDALDPQGLFFHPLLIDNTIESPFLLDLPGLLMKMSPTTLTEVARDARQKIVDDQGRVIATDTDKDNGAFAFAIGSFMDQVLAKAVLDRGLVDGDLGRAVLMVDFTRPFFSAARCGLLEKLAPVLDALPANQRDAHGIRAAITKALDPNAAPGSPVRQLADNLKQDVQAFNRRGDAFVAACNARAADPAQQRQYHQDLQAVFHLNRERARKEKVMASAATLPRDEMVVRDDAHMDPETCTLVCARPPCAALP